MAGTGDQAGEGAAGGDPGEEAVRLLVEEATFDFTLGEHAVALEKLHRAVGQAPGFFPAWHALAEVHYAEGDFDAALEAAQRAHTIDPDDVHINTSLSRIWVERGDKETAEHFGARARTLSWKEELRHPPPEGD